MRRLREPVIKPVLGACRRDVLQELLDLDNADLDVLDVEHQLGELTGRLAGQGLDPVRRGDLLAIESHRGADGADDEQHHHGI